VDKRQARAFEAFAAESGAELLRVATLLTSDPHIAEDVYQETLQRLAARWSRVDNPRAFCRRVMHNIVIDQSRAAARRPRETRHDSPTQAQFAAMPTDPAALRALLISQYDQQQKRADAAMAAQLKQKDKILRRAHRPAIKPLRLTASDKVFEHAGLLLWNPLAGPALRSAVFKVLAATPGVRVNSHARDSLGRGAVEISWFDRVTSVTLATFEDPSTTRMLEQADTATPAAVNGHTGSTGRDLYLSVTRARAVPPNPYR
jgi:DNA-directed RNA polymerase specialized sigma24 family protein